MSTKALLACLVALIPASGFAQSLVCDGKIINTGISQAEVSAKCGQPVQVDLRPRTQFIGGNGVTGVTDETLIELWTYNFGPNKLMQRIWFEDGLVARIESLGYGFN